MKQFVYVLRLKNGQYYVGSTNDIKRRFVDHIRGNTPTTKRIPAEEILFQREYSTKKEAKQIEIFLKKQKSRILIEKFMTNEWKKL